MFDKFAAGAAIPSGLELTLRAMGLGSVLDAAKHLAESGAVQKIIKFADGLEELNERMARIEAALGLEPWQRPGGAGPGGERLVIEGSAVELRRADAEPGPRAGAGGGS